MMRSAMPFTSCSPTAQIQGKSAHTRSATAQIRGKSTQIRVETAQIRGKSAQIRGRTPGREGRQTCKTACLMMMTSCPGARSVLKGHRSLDLNGVSFRRSYALQCYGVMSPHMCSQAQNPSIDELTEHFENPRAAFARNDCCQCA